MRTVGIRTTLALAALSMLAGAYLEMRQWVSSLGDTDFTAYYTGASLVRKNLSAQLYDFASRDIDPSMEGPSPDTVFYRIGRAHGLPTYSLYDYPPTLADLLVPLTLLSPLAAMIVWQMLCVFALVASGVMLTRMVGMRSLSCACLITLFILAFRPTLDSFNHANTPVILLFLFLVGTHLYLHEQKGWAGLAFALAAAIKLTPMIVVVPFVAWRDWRILRAISLWGVAILGVLFAVNGARALGLYFLHVVPLMFHRLVYVEDFNLITAVQVLWYRSDKVTPAIKTLWAGRLLSVLILCHAGWLSRLRDGEHVEDERKIETLAAFMLLSCCLAPISWLYMYVLSTPAVVILGKRVWRGRSGFIETVFLLWFIVSLSINPFVGLAVRAGLPILHYHVIAAPLLGVALGIMMLHRQGIGEAVTEQWRAVSS